MKEFDCSIQLPGELLRAGIISDSSLLDFVETDPLAGIKRSDDEVERAHLFAKRQGMLIDILHAIFQDARSICSPDIRSFVDDTKNRPDMAKIIEGDEHDKAPMRYYMVEEYLRNIHSYSREQLSSITALLAKREVISTLLSGNGEKVIGLISTAFWEIERSTQS